MKKSGSAILMLSLLVASAATHAGIVTYQATGMITGISVFTDGFGGTTPVSSTAGTFYPFAASVGDAFSVTYSFESSTPAASPGSPSAANYYGAVTGLAWSIPQTGSVWSSPTASASYNLIGIYGQFPCEACGVVDGYQVSFGGQSMSVGGAFGTNGAYQYNTTLFLFDSAQSPILLTSPALNQLPDVAVANAGSSMAFNVLESGGGSVWYGGAGVIGTISDIVCTSGCSPVPLPGSGPLLLPAAGLLAIGARRRRVAPLL